MPEHQRTTIYLEKSLHRALRLKAAATGETLSKLVNRAVQLTLSEDLEDLEDLDARAGEPSRPFEEFLLELKADGLV